MPVRLNDRRRTHETQEVVITQRTALVGGGAAGIGYAIAARLAPAHRVVITGRHADTLEKAAARLREQAGADVGTLVSDVADPDSAGAVMSAVADRYGPPDVLVLNAGGPPPGRILDVTDDAWRVGTELLLLGPLRLARLALPSMAARGFGRLVFITSTAVRQPQPDLAISVVLRAGVTAAAKLLSLEHAVDGVTVNCVAPGATDTQRRRDILMARADRTGRSFADLDAADTDEVPAGRSGHPEEIAAAVAFLTSAVAGYVNGTVLTVDGGRTETF
ncbi:MAG TPA: SDR family oxidoreductase [Streptosporangiaceae bacterium]|jgi:3-oxoacyl-[acyl-carrier protein] reductase